MKPKHRPRTTKISRTEQLRIAKRAQRERQRRAGIRSVQLDLADDMAERLRVARRDPGFLTALDELLDRFVVRVADHPQLRDLAWNRVDEFITAREAFGLYERNWRLVDENRLDERERELIDRLAAAFGAGVINA
jgi:hypothetical protein